MPDPITANELEQRGWTYDPSTGKCEAKWTITVPQRDHIIAALREHESRAGGYWVGDKNGDSHLVINGSISGSVTPVAGQFCTYIDSCPVWRYESLATAKLAVEKAVRND